tara:strand:+ start:1518 stop:3518 length:2001 start_codon:yes stop_codon:yes gene_type:complete
MTDNVLEENDLIIYKDLQEKKSSKTYIVCNSNYNKTENSKYNYEFFSISKHHNYICIKDLSNNWYQKQLKFILGWLTENVTDISNVIFVGVSMGGYLANYLAFYFEATCITWCPQFNITRTFIEEHYNNTSIIPVMKFDDTDTTNILKHVNTSKGRHIIHYPKNNSWDAILIEKLENENVLKIAYNTDNHNFFLNYNIFDQLYTEYKSNKTLYIENTEYFHDLDYHVFCFEGWTNPNEAIVNYYMIDLIRDMNVNFTYFKDITNTWYSQETFEIFTEINKRKCKKNIFIGCSMGGYAALMYSMLVNNEDDVALVFNPQTSYRESNTIVDLKELIEKNDKIHIEYYVSKNSEDDFKHIRNIERNNKIMVHEDASDDHNLPVFMYADGSFKKAIDDCVKMLNNKKEECKLTYGDEIDIFEPSDLNKLGICWPNDTVCKFFAKQMHVFGGQITAGDALFIYKFMEMVKPTRMIEIGVASGFSSSFILSAADNLNLFSKKRDEKFLYSYDIDEFNGEERIGCLVSSEFKQYEKYWQFTPNTSLRLNTFEGNVLAFVDGGHEHPWPLIDIIMLRKKLPDQSWIMLQDVKLNERLLQDQIRYDVKYDNKIRGVDIVFSYWPGEKYMGTQQSYNMCAIQLNVDDNLFGYFVTKCLLHSYECDVNDSMKMVLNT